MNKIKHRIFVDQTFDTDSTIALTDQQSHYLSRVLRVRVSDPVIAFDGKGTSCSATISSLNKNGGTLELGQSLQHEPNPALAVTLIQAIAKGEKMDWIMQKATELGATTLQPVVTDRTVVKLNPDKVTRRVQRWQSVVVNACEQCNRNHLPVVQEPTSLNEALQRCTANRKLVLTLDAEKKLSQVTKPDGSVALVVGPEGGLDKHEIAQAMALGFEAVGLGPRTLRTETAAITSLAMTQCLWGDVAAK